MKFDLAEKLAIVNAVDSIIIADGVVHSGEIGHMQKLMGSIDFDTNFMVYARNLTPEEGIDILKGMSDTKKNALARILLDVANSDGFVHAKETAVMSRILTAIGYSAEIL